MSLSEKSAGRLWARYGLDPVRGAIDGIYLEWVSGRFTRVEQAARPPAGLQPSERLENCLVTPGLLNAHCHLDYSFLRGKLPRGVGFVPWLKSMIEARNGLADKVVEEMKSQAQRAVGELLRDGTTEVWDIRSFGWGGHFLQQTFIAAIQFSEFIAPRNAAWQFDLSPQLEGLSPHSAYSVVPRALEHLTHEAAGRSLPLAIHLAESPEERELLIQGNGPLRDLFAAQFNYDPVQELGTGLSAIARAERAGALGPGTLAIHCNLPEPGEIDRLAASRAVVVFCPCSHQFFGYPDYPLAEMRKAGVRLALGTDSLASNNQLSIRAEARALLSLPAGGSMPPLEILGMMTGAGLGDEPPFGGRGRLQANGLAAWVAWQIQSPVSLDCASLIENILDHTLLAGSSVGG